MPGWNRPSRKEQSALRQAFYERIEQGEMSIPEAMKAMRKITGLTQEEFAAHRGVSRRVIQDIERGTGNPTVDSLRDGIKKTPMGAVNLFGKLLTFGHLNNWSQGWARRLLRTTCGH